MKYVILADCVNEALQFMSYDEILDSSFFVDEYLHITVLQKHNGVAFSSIVNPQKISIPINFADENVIKELVSFGVYDIHELMIHLELIGYVIEVDYKPSSIKDLINQTKPHIETSQERIINSLKNDNNELMEEIASLKKQLSHVHFSSKNLIEELNSLCNKNSDI